MPPHELTTEERNWALAAHLSALIAVTGLPFGHVVGPLIVHLVKGSQSPFVGQHAKASLNYQITISLVGLVAIIAAVCFFFAFAVGMSATTAGPEGGASSAAGAAFGVGIVGLYLLVILVVLALFVISLIFIIMGAMAASEGRPYTYPFSIRFVR